MKGSIADLLPVVAITSKTPEPRERRAMALAFGPSRQSVARVGRPVLAFRAHLPYPAHRPDALPRNGVVSLDRGVVKYAEGSCFTKFGDNLLP